MKRVAFGLSLLCVLAIPSFLHAQTKFGGMAVSFVPCTCTGGKYSAYFFSPLYLNSGVPTTGLLAVPNTGTKYPNYFVRVKSWVLGSYTPGVQACWMIAYPSCVIYPTLGVVSRDTGVSR